MAKSISSYNPSQISILVFLSSIFSFHNLSPTTKIAAESHWYNCTSNITFAPGTTFQSNLTALLSSLSSKAASNTTEFYNTTSGDANNKDTFYGLFMCSGDVTLQNCGKCVTKSTQELTSQCPFSKKAVIWHAECLVRYSNRPFISTMDEKPMLLGINYEDYPGKLERFYKASSSLMEDLINQASDAPIGSRKFAVNQKNICDDRKLLYGLAQCTPDLTGQDCRQCLKDASAYLLQNSCARGKTGGRVMYPSCIIRYELYPFYPHNLLRATGKRSISSLKPIIIVVPIVILVVIFGFGWCLMRRKARKNLNDLGENFQEEVDAEVKSLKFDLGTIQDATNNFSADNKIGQGGFGEVYKGMLFNGQEIAVKRLSRHSSQGAVEFKNEVLLIAKLQHKNLIRLLGFAMEGEEKILVYEFVQNKSLDYYLFSSDNKRLLTWSERYKIIGGIARGILYLHEDSRLKIIHRDLKPSNILLDGGMNPKISDFGMAKIVDVDQWHGNTNRIAGTYGYMSPEYAMHGQFSVKSDVFSFGVVVLEIVTGRRNAHFDESGYVDDLLSYAWKNWMDQRSMELLDPRLKETSSEIEVIRCIQIGLLCVQEKPDDRPTMATIALYFNFFSADLPLPREPAFFMQGKTESSLRSKNVLSLKSY